MKQISNMWMILGLILGLSMTFDVQAQTGPGTQVRPQQLKGLTSPAGTAFVVLPGGTVVLAQLGEGLVLDTSGAVPVLRVSVPIPPAPVLPIEVVGEEHTPSGPDGRTVTLANTTVIPGSVKVYVNGIRQVPAQSYAITGNVITFVPGWGNMATAGDVVHVDYVRQP